MEDVGVRGDARFRQVLECHRQLGVDNTAECYLTKRLATRPGTETW